MKSALANSLVISLLLTSCAKHPDTKITVKVPMDIQAILTWVHA